MNDFDDLTGLDDVFGPLRSPARSAELSQENATVDLMVKAHRTSEGKHMFTSRRARIATLVATGVLGFGGMAAASPGLGGDDPVLQDSTVESTEELTVAEEVETPVVPAPVVPEPVDDEAPVVPAPVDDQAPVVPEPVDDQAPAADSDPDVESDESFCVVSGNHGKTVSAVARFLARGESDPSFAGYTGDLTVKMAAQSSCGKNDEVDLDEVEDEPEIEDEPEVEDKPEVDEPKIDDDSESEPENSEAKADRPDKSDKGAEKAANGNGKSNGNGNRDD